jgi:phosphoribosylformimino-5-aminoimidazole carboxamide ribotide isomerase
VIAIPAVDLRGGSVGQLVGGSYAEERVRLGDPVGVARSWAQMGFRRLHVVDLDAATGVGSNDRVVEDILHDDGAEVQVGGGIRTTESIQRLIDAGAERVVVGTRAIEEPEWLGYVADLYPGLIVVATDVRERRVVTRGWVRTLPLDVLDLVQDLNAFELGGILVTAVHLEGQLRGTDLTLMEDVAETSRFPVIASGGVTTMHDLRALEHRGLDAVVIGMALYTGMLDSRAVAQEYGT